MKYKQLTQEQRYQIYELRKEGKTITEIAKEIGVHKSTISRELKRNKGLRGYRPDQAQRISKERKSRANKAPKIDEYTKNYVKKLIKLDWSPEQISGYFM